MQNISFEIADKYNLDIKNIVPFRNMHIILTSKGKKFLKCSALTPERVLFVHGAKEHLFNNDFKNLDRYLCTTEGKPYICMGNNIYTITEMIEGAECDFDNRSDIVNAAKTLALMHKASRGFVPPENSIARDNLGKLPIYFNKRLNDMKKLKKEARKGKSKFDYLFLDCFDYFYRMGEGSIDMVSNVKYDKLVESSRREGVLCHHDFTHHNIIYDANKMSIINFDFCCYDLKIYDVANFIRRKMRKCNWNIDEAKVIIDEYCSVGYINQDELQILKATLQFPQKFWRVANKYYNTNRSWSERTYIAKLQEVKAEIDSHSQFMNDFDKLGDGTHG